MPRQRRDELRVGAGDVVAVAAPEPRLAVGDSTLSTGGAIAGAAAVLVTLLFAILGGKMGERFHKRVDRIATDEYVTER